MIDASDPDAIQGVIDTSISGGNQLDAIASVAGKVSYVGEPAYVASKYAVVGFCDSVRKELIGTGVRVSIIEPGFVDSPMTRNQPEMAKRMNKIKALETDDVARVIEFILDQPPHCSISEVMIRPTEQEL